MNTPAAESPFPQVSSSPSPPLRAPFPWFGGKSRAAEMIWDRFGPVPNYVEPFFGSGAVMLRRPHAPGIETINDKDCFVANVWRAVQQDPEKVAFWADQPVNEADLHARHLWLVCQEGFRERMLTDPDYFDAKIAGWWVWGIGCWIGSGWCYRPDWGGRISATAGAVRGIHSGIAAITRKRRPQLSTQNGVHIKPHQKHPMIGGNEPGRGVHRAVRQIPDISGDGGASGRGIHGSGNEDKTESILAWMQALADRLRNVRVCCGDWSRLLGRSPTECIGVTAILLDPPYGTKARRKTDIYSTDCLKLASSVRDWAVAHGDNQLLRICLCGYEGEHEMPDTWKVVPWKANGGYGNNGAGNGRDNADRERLWFSPHCLDPDRQPELFPKPIRLDVHQGTTPDETPPHEHAANPQTEPAHD